MMKASNWLLALFVLSASSTVSTAEISTLLYGLDKSPIKTPKDFGGGAIAALGPGVIIASSHGQLAYLQSGRASTRIEPDVPMNLKGYSKAAAPLLESGRLKPGRFRLADIAIRQITASTYELFATHHYYKPECIEYRLSKINLRKNEDSVVATGGWQTAYVIEPCLKFFDRGHTFPGHQSGGRILFDEESKILISVGDVGRDGTLDRPQSPMDPDSNLGKLIQVDTTTGKSEIVVSGLRNPQGLARGTNGEIWETEHGPQGGDELNLLTPGRNYGWPRVTFGIQYGSKDWPLNTIQGRHELYEVPIFSWVPSVGVSEIIALTSKKFLLWEGDLVIGTLKDRSLLRVRLEDSRVVYVERIEVGVRVRDLAQLRDGSIAVLGDRGRVFSVAPSLDSCLPEAPPIYQKACSSTSTQKESPPEKREVVASEINRHTEKIAALTQLMRTSGISEQPLVKTNARIFDGVDHLKISDQDDGDQPGHQKSARWSVKSPHNFVALDILLEKSEHANPKAAIEIVWEGPGKETGCFIHFRPDGSELKAVPRAPCESLEFYDEISNWRINVASYTTDSATQSARVVVIPALGKNGSGGLNVKSLELGSSVMNSELLTQRKLGKSLFRDHCQTCHSLSASTNGVGPSLQGLPRRPIASVPGFAYSQAASSLEGQWDPARLADFIKNPEAVASGTPMPPSNLSADDSRAIAIFLLSR